MRISMEQKKNASQVRFFYAGKMGSPVSHIAETLWCLLQNPYTRAVVFEIRQQQCVKFVEGTRYDGRNKHNKCLASVFYFQNDCLTLKINEHTHWEKFNFSHTHGKKQTPCLCTNASKTVHTHMAVGNKSPTDTLEGQKKRNPHFAIFWAVGNKSPTKAKPNMKISLKMFYCVAVHVNKTSIIMSASYSNNCC